MSDAAPSRFARAVVWVRRVYVLSMKELQQFSRDLALIIFLVYAFTLSVLAAATGVSMELKNAATMVVDNDQSAASRELIHRFRPPYFRLDGALESGREGVELLDRGKAMIVLEIPPRFQQSLDEGRPTAVQMQIDATNATLGFLGSSYGERIVGQYALDVTSRRADLPPSATESLPTVENRQRVWFNPNLDQVWFQGLEQIAKMITLFAMLLPAAAMAREKERGTIEQLLVSPLKPVQIMLSKVLPMTGVIVLATAMSLFLVIQGILEVPVRGSLVLYLALTALFAFTVSGVGLLIASVTRNVAQVGLMSILIMVPMLLLSGSYTPLEGMPPLLRPLMYVSPLHHYLDIMYGILLKGAGLRLLWDSALMMALVGAVIFGLGMWRFRRQFA